MFPSTRLVITGLLLFAGLSVGCQLVDPITVTLRKPRDLFLDDEGKLPPLPKARDAISLEIVFIERRANDPLLGSALWQHLDQIGALPPETRHRLSTNGLRLGHAGRTAPPVLQSLLKLSNDRLDENNPAARDQGLAIRRVTLPANIESEIHVSPLFPSCSFHLETDDGVDIKEYENARCQLRLQAKRLQDGWAQIDLVPEVLHGKSMMRHVVIDGGWQMRQDQLREKFFDQSFSLRLNQGEMAILTAGVDQPNSLGHCFFRGPEGNDDFQRVMLIRLVGMEKIQPVYSE